MKRNVTAPVGSVSAVKGIARRYRFVVVCVLGGSLEREEGSGWHTRDMTAADSKRGSSRALAEDFTAKHLASTLVSGVIFAMVNALLTVALMSLIFSGPLKDALPVGIGLGLVGSAVVAIVAALMSSFPGMYAGIQDNSAAILGLSAASIVSSVAGPEALSTVLAMMAVTSLATGMVFLLMARLRLGEIARFVPFPVIGGLLAGTGYLIVIGSLRILGITNKLGSLMSTDALGLLWPGLVLAGVFFAAARREWAPRVYLWVLVTGVGGFHILTRLFDIDKASALGRGWLLGPFPDGGLWPGVVSEALARADWAALVGQAASLGTILLIVPLTLLLYISALEMSTNRDLELNSELSAAGWANVASAAVGGPPGYIYLSDTVIAHRILGPRRGAAVVAGVGLLIFGMLGGKVLEFLPEFIVGGLLLYVGFEFLFDWLWESRRRMALLDYVLMVSIVLVIATLGLLPGVLTGLVAAIALFVYRYSRIDVVKHLLTAREHQSNIERSEKDAEFLRESGDAVRILELQGFIFFGTANRILERIKEELAISEPLRFVVFDFRLVTGVDSSAVALFDRIASLAKDNGLTLLLSNLKPVSEQQFEQLILRFDDTVRTASDLDHAVAWCEDLLLAGFDRGNETRRALPDGLDARLGGYLEARTFGVGERLMTQGDPSPGMFLIRSGTATVLLEGTDRGDVRLRTLLEGTVLGEISLYRGEPCTATVVADTECEVMHLTPAAFASLCAEDPTAAAELHSFVARTLAGRLGHANRTIRALQL